MSICLAIGTFALTLVDPVVTLSWTHSVEKVTWEEAWHVTATGLTLRQSRIKGSGAGMEPGPDAVLQDGWWVSPGHLDVPELTLAASGATEDGWTLCGDGNCRVIGAEMGAPITLSPCR